MSAERRYTTKWKDLVRAVVVFAAVGCDPSPGRVEGAGPPAARLEIEDDYVFDAALPPPPAGPIPDLTFINYAPSNTFKQAVVSAQRATPDLRLLVGVDGGTARFFLQRPEALTENGVEKPVLYAQQEAGQNPLALYWDGTRVFLSQVVGEIVTAEGSVLCATRRATAEPTDHGGNQWMLDEGQGPYTSEERSACPAGADCYETTLVWTHRRFGTGVQELWSADFDVTVTDPKTAEAQISSAVYVPGTVRASPAHPGVKAFPGDGLLEPAITADGRLVVIQGGGLGGLLYAMNTTENPCHADAWTTFKPISEMHTDPDVAHYGLAKHPFRSNEGIAYAPGEILRGTYPWVDRDGSNLVFGSATSPLATVDNSPPSVPKTEILLDHSDVSDGHGDWYTAQGGYERLPQLGAAYGGSFEELVSENNTRTGEAVAGLWTRGKMVLLDGRLNSMVQATGYLKLAAQPEAFGCFTLFNEDKLTELSLSCPTQHHSHDPCMRYRCEVYDLLRRGSRMSARAFDAPDDQQVPIYFSANFELLGFENALNFMPTFQPVTTSDVSWIIGSSFTSDYVSFDDMLYVDALIVSDMMPSESFTGKAPGDLDANVLNHGLVCVHAPSMVCAAYSGTTTPRVQNVATSTVLPRSGLVPPPSGLLRGGARVENAAAGGIRGRGVYLDGVDDHIEYDVLSSGDTLESPPWHVSLWVNPKHLDTDADGWRTLFTLPDGTAVAHNAAGDAITVARGAVLATFALPVELQLDGDAWTHLAFNTKVGSVLGKTIVALSIDGFLLEQKEVLTPIDGRPFTMGSGVLRVGAASSGFDGWVDEFRVFEAWLGPVDICGTAYGRLVGDDAADATSPYPASSHAELTALIADPSRHYPAYRCERYRPDHFDYAAELADKVCIGKGDSDPRCVGDAIVFPEGPVYVDAPRPDATQNGFCARCHSDSSPSSTLSRTLALQAIETPFSLSHDAFDRRRQPRNPPRTVFGHPGSFLEPHGLGTDPRGIEIDDLTFPALP